jgi:hypothetical protein
MNGVRKEFPFAKTRDQSGRRAAEAACIAYEAQIRDANNQRAQQAGIRKPLTEREHQQGGWMPDTRSLSERIRADITHIAQPKTPDDFNPFLTRIADLELRIERANPRDKPQWEHRLRLALAESSKREAEIAERQAFVDHMNSTPVVDAKLDANSWLARLSTNPAVPQQWVDDARARHKALELTGDVDSYWRDTLAFEADRRTHIEANAKEKQAEAGRALAEANRYRRQMQGDKPLTSENNDASEISNATPSPAAAPATQTNEQPAAANVDN